MKAVELEPARTEALFGCGICCIDLKNFSKAVDYFCEFLKYKPDSCEAYCKLGVSLLQLGHANESMKAFDMAVQIDQMNAEAYFYRKQLQRENNEKLTSRIQSGSSEDDASKTNKGRIHGSIIRAIEYFKKQKIVTTRLSLRL